MGETPPEQDCLPAATGEFEAEKALASDPVKTRRAGPGESS
jgi:hypothetical protein